MRSQADTSANDRLYYPPERGVQASTINNRVAEVKKFYDTNDIELRWKKIKSYTGRRKIGGAKETGLTPILKSSTFTTTRR
jgi:hypothetical protein